MVTSTPKKSQKSHIKSHKSSRRSSRHKASKKVTGYDEMGEEHLKDLLKERGLAFYYPDGRKIGHRAMLCAQTLKFYDFLMDIDDINFKIFTDEQILYALKNDHQMKVKKLVPLSRENKLNTLKKVMVEKRSAVSPKTETEKKKKKKLRLKKKKVRLKKKKK